MSPCMREARRKFDFATSVPVTEIDLIRIINDSFFHRAHFVRYIDEILLFSKLIMIALVNMFLLHVTPQCFLLF